MAPNSLTTTRRSLHGIAELVLAGPQYRATGEIMLRVTGGGFATVFAPELSFDGVRVVAGERRIEVTGLSYADVAAKAGVAAGEPAGLYEDGSGARPEELVELDPAAARTILGAFAAGDEALRRFAPDAERVLWPEHFDVGITVAAVNYGVAPGDGHVPEPYAYVSPHTARAGAFWNAPFGAARPVRELGSVPRILEFFEAGRELAR
jgi:hypothetical protein